MPRPLRIQDAGYVHHVITRGNDRQVIFKETADFKKYLDLVDHARKQYPIKIYNFVLMDNHVHLLVEPTEDGNLSKAMEAISKGYARYFNKKYNHVGHVFQGRFKSFLIQRERYFFICCRYIDLNPFKANLVKDPKEYKWSGHEVWAYGKEGVFKLDMHPLIKGLGNNPAERGIAYRALINSYQGEEIDLLDKRATVLGDKDFKKQMKALG